MVQDIFPKKLFNQYDIREPEQGSYIIFVQGNTLLCRIEDGVLTMPTYREVNLDDYRYLIRIDDDLFFSSWDASAIAILESDGYEFHNIKELRPAQPEWLKFGTLTAFSYASWYEKNRYCGRCGAFMKHSDTERAMICPECRNLVYPKICPVVIVGVIHGDTILLTKYKDRMRFDKYALIAGFAEIGETIEQTVAREVYEETGIKVKNLKFYKSQPWAFSDSLLMGFFCEPDGDKGPCPDGEELGFAGWMTRDKVPALQDNVSLTAEMMDLFKRKGREVLG
ncbi:MAG: NAD(+) diphosphatase [Lachnospiraceae bacterium]|nr:NAD(+) diphosphatase [Lachnospiraceae bacterium]